MAGGGSGALSVPPGFRFHPTDEELLYYYLRKKVSYEAIDLDVIREVDLNKLEPWDLKDKCRIGTGPQNEWYFFSHKDKKYPTGTRTNRATAAGFWKATGRDKAIHLNASHRIGMRKTLVFYTGRAPHGHKTDWIMHEYRLDDDNSEVQEDGWVVCRVFKKKNQARGYLPQQQQLLQLPADHDHDHDHDHDQLLHNNNRHHHHHIHDLLYNNDHCPSTGGGFDGSMHLPQLFSAESVAALGNISAGLNNNNHNNNNNMGHESASLMQSHGLLSLTPGGGYGGATTTMIPHDKFININNNANNGNADWSFLDKLLASSSSSTSQSHHQRALVHHVEQGSGSVSVSASHSQPPHTKFPFPLSGCDPAAIFKFPQ